MNRKTFPVAAICRVLGISPSGYYAWRGRREISARARLSEALGVEIRAIHRQYKQRYGIRKMRYELMRLGWRVNHKRVARLMRENGLRSQRAKQRRTTTNSNHSLPVAQNREFTATRPNTKWVGDITFVPTGEGWMYLAVVMDLWSRRVVGWEMHNDLSRELVMAAFDDARAIQKRV